MHTVIKIDENSKFYVSVIQIVGAFADNVITQNKSVPDDIWNILTVLTLDLEQDALFSPTNAPHGITETRRDLLIPYLEKFLFKNPAFMRLDLSQTAVIRQTTNDLQREEAITQSI